mmetsp:Transcript_19576/g.35436  ORF Transcript_19576/g.35436 Transcript_19576/m.35436 type:complete len:103 (-) Transcript_19576:54-362(-)
MPNVINVAGRKTALQTRNIWSSACQRFRQASVPIWEKSVVTFVVICDGKRRQETYATHYEIMLVYFPFLTQTHSGFLHLHSLQPAPGKAFVVIESYDYEYER